MLEIGPHGLVEGTRPARFREARGGRMKDTRLHRPAEDRYHDELEALIALDADATRPPGWALSPRRVLEFVVGREPVTMPDGRTVPISAKFQGSWDIVEAAIATLASDRALLLVGPPGTAKSMLSEWLAAAICGSSRLIVQGSAGVTEDHVRYSWNYALLLKEGPTAAALKPSPILQAMQDGRIARLEEMTRCISEVQDALISLLSEKELAIPEMDNLVVAAQRGFNVIATANTADKGVHEMSSALKRRFNFVNVPPVQDVNTEIAIVKRRTAELMSDHCVTATVPDGAVDALVTMFAVLRGQIGPANNGARRMPTEISSAQLISTLFDGALRASYFGDRTVSMRDLARSIASSMGDNATAVGEVLDAYEGAFRRVPDVHGLVTQVRAALGAQSKRA
jgi:MoxR-like ATPase